MNKPYELINSIIDGEHCLETCKSFLNVNVGDEATQLVILSIFCELFDCSSDLLIESLNKYYS